MTYFLDNVERTAGYEPGFQPQGSDVVKLNTNENPYPPSPKVLEAIREIPAERLRKYPQPLGDSFRTAAGEALGVPSDWILCTNGGDELLSICIRAFCDLHHPVAYPNPTYSLYPVLARLQNCPALELSFDDPNVLDHLAETGAALTIVCNPNAPTGRLIGAEQLGELSRRLKGVLLIDEAYVDFAAGSCLPLVKECGNVILLRSMSKGYSLAGIRFGFGIAQPQMIEGLLKVKDSYNVDAMSIEAATAAIRDQAYHRVCVAKVKTERTRLTAELRKLGLEVADSESNFVLARSPKVPAKDIYRALADRNIFVRYFALPGLDDKLRISIGTPEQDNRLLESLRAILAAK
jgi:histidinol-phosphate aminotransferase